MEIKKIINKYEQFIKYVFSAGISFVIDLILFTIFNAIFKNFVPTNSILLGTILARVISSFINYHLNRNTVFKNNNDKTKIDKTTFSKYVILVIIQMFVSSISVTILYNLTKLNETLIKIPVECILFMINYVIQKLFIFKKEKEPNNMKEKLKKHNLIIISILSIITSFSILVKLNTKTVITWSRIDTDTLLYALVTLGIFYFYKNFFEKNTSRAPFKILSLLFTLLLIFGYSFDTTDSAYLVYGNPSFIIISILKFIGFYPFIYTILNTVYDKLINLKIKDTKKSKLYEWINRHPFKFSMIVLLIAYLPYIIAYYPAVMGYDPANQIKEVMGIHNRYMDSVVLLDPNVTITNFNPVIHTLLLGNCFKLGVNIGSVNLGLFLYSIIQISFMITVLAYSIKFLKKEGTPNKILLIILAIYAFIPIFPFYSLSTNKDTFFTLFVLLYIIKYYEIFKYKYSKKNLFEIIIISILLFLSRNNGIYVILLSLPFCLLYKNNRKQILMVLLCVTISYLGYSKIILPYFKITPTSIREVLSIPFQQTAALIQRDEDIIDAKDKETISKILDYETIKKSYDPELADRVKNTFNRNYKQEDLNKYFNIWFKYLIKRPLIYIDATINNMYGYFYPNTVRWYLYCDYNTKLEEAGFDYHFNGLSTMRLILAAYGNAFQYIPLLGLFVNIGFTVWIYMYLVAALIVNKNKKMILLILPALSLILICVASPANAYFRYAMPYIMTLPLVLALLYQNKKLSKDL